MARVSGFGQTGPYAERAGYGLIGEAMGGLRYVTGEPDRPPARAGISIGDSLAAMHAVMGITMALHERERTGRGQVIDAALYESVLAVMENLVTEYDLTGYERERSGSVLPGIAPSNAYPTAGGELILIGGNGDTVFARLTEAMGRTDLKADPKFVDHASRGVNQHELDAVIADWTSGFALPDLLALLESKGVPSSRVFRAPDMLEDPQFVAREAIVTTDHPVFGPVRMQNAFPKLSRTPGAVRWPGPALGAHTDEVLGARGALHQPALAELRKAVICTLTRSRARHAPVRDLCRGPHEGVGRVTRAKPLGRRSGPCGDRRPPWRSVYFLQSSLPRRLLPPSRGGALSGCDRLSPAAFGISGVRAFSSSATAAATWVTS